MSVPFSAHYFRRHHFPVFCIVHLEIFCVPEVLKNISVFIRNCDPHDSFSFRSGIYPAEFLFPAGIATTHGIASVTELIISASDAQRSAVNQCICQFLPRTGIYMLHSCPGDLHKIAALFLRHALLVDKTYSLVLIHSHHNGIAFCLRSPCTVAVCRFFPVIGYRAVFNRHIDPIIVRVLRGETQYIWKMTYSPAFSRP